MAGPLLTVESLSKSFGGEAALTSVDLSLERGEVRGLIGANGSGKSTLVKVLAGFHRPDRGSGPITVDGEVVNPHQDGGIAGFRFIHQDLGLIPEMSVCDNLMMDPTPLGRLLLPRSGGRERRLARDLISRYGVSFRPETPVETLSASDRTMLALMRALHRGEDEIRCLILDEATAPLSPRETERVVEVVRELSAGCGVIFVSHSMDEVRELCDTATVLRSSRKIGDVVVAETEESALVQMLTGRALGALYPEVQPPQEDTVLAVRGLSGSVVADIDLEVQQGAIVGLASLDRAEPAAILSLIYGLERRTAGQVGVSGAPVDPAWGPPEVSKLGVRLVTDRLVSSIPSFSVRENLTVGGLKGVSGRWRLSERRERLIAAEMITAFGIAPPRPEATFAGLSGGNQQKVVLARSMRLRPKLLLLDDPNRGVDIGAKAAIYRVIRDAADEGLAVLIASTDFDELCALCHRVVVLRRGRINAVVGGEGLSTHDLLEHCYVESATAGAARETAG